MTLRTWQTEALNALRMNSYNGVIVAITGSGKTRVALEAIKELDVPTLIVVPTVALMNQWKEELFKIGYEEKDIGVFYGLVKLKRKITIGVINSIYEQVDLDQEFKLLVADECHRYGSNEHYRLFMNNTFQYRIGLTATLERQDGNHQILLQRIGSILYEYKIHHAKQEGIINDFAVINYGIDLPYNEKEYLGRLDAEIKLLMPKFDNDFSKVTAAVKKYNREAGRILKLVQKRKQFYHNSIPKIEKAVHIILANKDKKFIVFNEFIESADLLHRKLVEKGIQPLVYYSGSANSKFKFTAEEKRNIITKFKEMKTGVLITVKALDEGLDVRDVECGLLLGYTKTTRQAIQRMGRILRKVEGKRPIMYNIYYKDTSDFWNAKLFSENFKDEAKIEWK